MPQTRNRPSLHPMKTTHTPLIGLFTLLMLFSTALPASTPIVTNANDTGAGSLRVTITAAASGDTLVFDPLFFKSDYTKNSSHQTLTLHPHNS